MCGIVGIISPNAKRYRPQILGMIGTLKHRGPDGTGMYYFKNCALGHTRLSIVDLSGGSQPMLNSRRTTGIVFNGEIYGYLDLKKTLKTYNFTTASDTEVILALYEKYSTNLAKYLPGMFSFAIFDSKREVLYCARDRFGEKPLYYAYGKNGEFIFASEIKAIIKSGLLNPILDRDALSHYFKHLYVHPSRTIYKNIFTLPPGHHLVYKRGRLTITRYWEIPVSITKISLDSAVEEFGHLLDKAISSQLVADVPVGILLSGGLDSSTITAVATKHKKDIRTFSFGFVNFPSEIPYARQVAEKYSTKHQEIRENDFQISELLQKMQEVYDEPFADSSNIPTFLISQLTRRYCKVVMGGDGGDELLCGYSWYKPFLNFKRNTVKLENLSRIFYLMGKVASITNMKFISSISHNFSSLGLSLAKGNLADLHNMQNQYFSDRELESLDIHDHATFKYAGMGKDLVNNIEKIDIQNYLPGDILVKADRASMANSLELRAPFLDVDLATFLLRLPSSLKMNKEEDKIILRRFVKDLLPKAVRNRKKQGFGIGSNIKYWMKDKKVQEIKSYYLSNTGQRVFDILPYSRVQKYLSRDNYKSWILLNFALWADTHQFSIE